MTPFQIVAAEYGEDTADTAREIFTHWADLSFDGEPGVEAMIREAERVDSGMVGASEVMKAIAVLAAFTAGDLAKRLATAKFQR